MNLESYRKNGLSLFKNKSARYIAEFRSKYDGYERLSYDEYTELGDLCDTKMQEEKENERQSWLAVINKKSVVGMNDIYPVKLRGHFDKSFFDKIEEDNVVFEGIEYKEHISSYIPSKHGELLDSYNIEPSKTVSTYVKVNGKLIYLETNTK